MSSTRYDWIEPEPSPAPPDPPDVVGFVVWCAIAIFATALAGALWTV